MTKTLWTKDFIRITLATSLGAAGGIISGFALSFLVFDETGSTLASALVVAIQLLPGAVLPLLIDAADGPLSAKALSRRRRHGECTALCARWRLPAAL